MPFPWKQNHVICAHCNSWGGDTQLVESSEKACVGLNWLLQTWLFHALALKLSPPLKCHIICTNEIEPNKTNYNHPHTTLFCTSWSSCGCGYHQSTLPSLFITLLRSLVAFHGTIYQTKTITLQSHYGECSGYVLWSFRQASIRLLFYMIPTYFLEKQTIIQLLISVMLVL